MQDNTAEQLLSDILGEWHEWAKGYQHNRAYPGRSSGCGDYRPSRQYDGENGSLDAVQHIERMKTVDFEVSQIEEPGRSGLHMNARAIALGVSVFRSPRLPEDRIAALKIIAEARQELTRRLLARGVM